MFGRSADVMTEAQDTAHTSDAIGLLSKVRLMDTACIQKDPLLGVRADGWLNRGGYQPTRSHGDFLKWRIHKPPWVSILKLFNDLDDLELPSTSGTSIYGICSLSPILFS